MKKLATIVVILALAVGLTGCSNMSRKDQGMLAGGAIGGVAGNLVTGGSTAGTIVGAVGGGYVGRQMSN